ncbi:securin [Hippocampus zosterae]|uniref:securin n=1 Tax=Hippocampus zosterae TaxID=109293 RepID=UPI00223D0252|nr:securin [Hippocampus zosterae]
MTNVSVLTKSELVQIIQTHNHDYDTMAHITAQRENQSLSFIPEISSKTPLNPKTMRTPLRTGRKAFGVVNTQLSTPVVNQGKITEKFQEAKLKHEAQKKEDYPEIEKMIPYDPMEFEAYCVPEDLIPLGSLALAGLGFHQRPPLSGKDQHNYVPPLPSLSPERMPQCSDGCTEFDAFLQTIDELIIELPPLEPGTN